MQSQAFLEIESKWRELNSRWVASSDSVSSNEIRNFLEMMKNRSSEISNIEDREEMRLLIRISASRLRSLGEDIPVIDIDTDEYRPKVLTTRGE